MVVICPLKNQLYPVKKDHKSAILALWLPWRAGVNGFPGGMGRDTMVISRPGSV
jgi:hypothetical protein